MAAYEAALDAAPDDLGLYLEVAPELAEVLAWRKEFAPALDYLDEALRHRPEDRRLLRLRGQVLAWSGRFAEARSVQERLLAADPDDAEAHLRLAELDYWGLDRRAALAHLDAHDRKRPGHLEARDLRGRVEAVRLSELSLSGEHGYTVDQPDWDAAGLLYRRQLSGEWALWAKASAVRRFDETARTAGAGVERALPWRSTLYAAWARADDARFVPGEHLELALARPLAERWHGVLGYERQRFRAGAVPIPWAGASWQTHPRLKLSGRYLAVDRLGAGLAHTVVGEGEWGASERLAVLGGWSSGVDTGYLVTSLSVRPRRVNAVWGGLRLGPWRDLVLELVYRFQYREDVFAGEVLDDPFTRQDLRAALHYRF
ncbi:MAG: tetratricopeptide repeat protein [Planctomycetes bacterium]|nr:tetratricopeptide repeat protein [Planctomycetota bacterium]